MSQPLTVAPLSPNAIVSNRPHPSQPAIWSAASMRPITARCCRSTEAVELVSKLTAPNNGTAPSRNPNDNRPCARHTWPVIVIPCATSRRSAKTGRVQPRRPHPRDSRGASRLTKYAVQTGYEPVASFVVVIAEVTSPGANERPLPCSHARRRPGRFY